MSDSKSSRSSNNPGAERLDGSSADSDDNATTMRLRILDLEGELWPEDQGRAEAKEEPGTASGDEESGKTD